MPRIRLRKKPTRHDLLQLKKQLDLSKRAYHLLEEKQRLLLREYQDTKEKLTEKEIGSNKESKRAFKLLSLAMETNGIQKIRNATYDSKPNDELEIKWGSIKGVSIPILIPKIKLRKAYDGGYSILQTDIHLDKAVDKLENLLINFLEIAETQSILQALHKEIERTRIRVSALEQVMIPSLKDEIARIQNLLDDVERQHLVTIKWAQENQPSSF